MSGRSYEMAHRTSPGESDAVPDAVDHSNYALVWPVIMALVYAAVAALIILLL